MNNTTKGEWKVRFWNDDQDSDFFVEAPSRGFPHNIEIMGDDYGEHNGYPREQRLADATLIALAGNLAQKYSLEKLEAAVERLRKAWDSAIEGEMPLAVDDFLTAITPAGEKTTT